MIWHGTRCCREGVKGVDALGDFGNAAITVSEHARNPARIGQPSSYDSCYLLANRAGFRHRWLACIEMVKRDIVAEQRRRRRKAADEIGDAVTIEKVPLAVVLRMDQRIGRRHTVAKAISSRHDRLHGAVSVGHCGQVGLAKIFARSPIAVERKRRRSCAIAAGRATEDTGKIVAAPVRAGERIVGVILVERSDLANCRVKQRDLCFENISGLFRDIFETKIALLDTEIRKVASLDEDDADNPLACSHRRGDNLARIFGGAPGSYGAGTATLALDGNWRAREDLGEAYLSAVTHAYGAVQPVMPAGDGFRARVSAADALVHPQDDRERDLLDGDGVADFVGGFAAAAALLGNDAKLYHLDTSEPSTPKARTVSEEIARIVRGRLTNPRWIAGMLGHGHRGVAEIAQGVDALFAFAATTRVVPNHLFDIAHDALIGDEAVLAGMIGANRAGAAAIASRLRDALTRGLWVARRNAVAGELDRAIAKSQHDLGPSMEAAK